MKKSFFIFFIFIFSLLFADKVFAFNLYSDKNDFDPAYPTHTSILVKNCNPNSYFNLFPLYGKQQIIESFYCQTGSMNWGIFTTKHNYAVIETNPDYCPQSGNYNDCLSLKISEVDFFYPIIKIALPQNSLNDIFANAGTLFTDLWTIIAIAIGVPLAFYIINRAVAIKN